MNSFPVDGVFPVFSGFTKHFSGVVAMTTMID